MGMEEAVIAGEQSNDSGGGILPLPQSPIECINGTSGHVSVLKKQLAPCICIGFGDKDLELTVARM